MRPLSPGAEQNSLLLGINTDLVRRLLTPIAMKSDSSVEDIHLQLRQAYQCVGEEQKAPMEGLGKLAKLDFEERVLQHRGNSLLAIYCQVNLGPAQALG